MWIRRSFCRREAKHGGSEARGQGKALRGHPSSLPGLLREPREEPQAGNAAAERFLMGARAGMGAETTLGALSCRGKGGSCLCPILLGAGEFLEEKALEWCCLAVHPCRWTVASPAAREGPFIPPFQRAQKKLGIHPAADPILREPESWEGRDGGAKPLRLEGLV